MNRQSRSAAPPASAQLRAVADATSDGILTVDTDGVVRFANPAIEDILGYAPDELVGSRLTRIMDDDLAERHRAGFERYLETGERRLDWTDVELAGRHEDGTEVPLSVSLSEFTADGERFFTGIVRDITSRNAREQALERYRSAVETVADGVYALDENARFLTVNAAFAELTGYDRDELIGAHASVVTGPRSVAEFDEAQAQLERGEADVDTIETTIETADGEQFPGEIRMSLFPLGDGEYGRAGVLRDVSDRKRRERQLSGLHTFAQSLTAAETAEGVYHLAMATASDLLPNLLATAYRYDEDAGRLDPASHTPAVPNVGAPNGELLGADRSLAWTAFQRQERYVCPDTRTDDAVDDSATPLRSVAAVPFGSYGVLVSGATATAAFDREAVKILDLLAADVETALERVEREQTLRERADQLEERAAAMERANRINDLIRESTTALVRAESREGIEQAVCTKLANTDVYRFAWIGSPTATGQVLTPRASAGVERGYLDAIAATDGEDASGTEPGRRAVATRDVQVRNGLSANPPFEPWREEALQREYRSCIAVPLRYEDMLYGVLHLYAVESDAFDDLAVDVLTELGEVVAYAINAAERKNAVVSDSTVELSFELDDHELLPARLAAETDSRFEFESLVEQADGSLRVFFSIEGADPAVVRDYHDRGLEVESVDHVADREEGHLFEATLGAESFLASLLDYGVRPTELIATPSGTELTVELPQSGDVQAFLRMLLDTYEGVSLRTRRELDRPVRSDAEFRAHYRERLTDREAEVLQTAYYAGFFESPRRSSGSEVAEMLGVSQPTVNRHLRRGERKLLAMVFDERADE
ncbi:PAS domain S-box protein [Halorussus marinus]|uniref:PAS domain S-box protein n=1 Tax=Halorussus marinus TaxID=2505976 RepID=UPI0010923172|nr:PAS domain S-box protein [Halorussus marinus]